MPSGLAHMLMEEAESQNVYPFRDDHTVFFRREVLATIRIRSK
jgi:hypothetical protein